MHLSDPVESMPYDEMLHLHSELVKQKREEQKRK